MNAISLRGIVVGAAAGLLCSVASVIPAAATDPAPNAVSTLLSVSCPDDSLCLAVGYIQTSDRTAPLVDVRSDGGTWTQQQTGVMGTEFRDVSCGSATSCMALAGRHRDPRTAYHWDGSTWRQVRPPVPLSSTLVAVDCPGPNACVALAMVPHYTGKGTLTPEVLFQWNGTHWSKGRASRWKYEAVRSLSCLSATDCYGAGYVSVQAPGTAPSARFEPLIARWNGTSWSRITGLAGGRQGDLSAISCTAPGRCTAAGRRVPRSRPDTPMIITLRGSTTTYSAFAASSGQQSAGFVAVACRTARRCTASEQYTSDSSSPTAPTVQYSTVADRSGSGDFAFSTQRFHNLTAVACQRTGCTVVGSTQLQNGPYNPSTAVAFRGRASHLRREAVPAQP